MTGSTKWKAPSEEAQELVDDVKILVPEVLAWNHPVSEVLRAVKQDADLEVVALVSQRRDATVLKDEAIWRVWQTSPYAELLEYCRAIQ